MQAENVQAIAPGRVTFTSASQSAGYAAALCLRSATRVLQLIHEEQLDPSKAAGDTVSASLQPPALPPGNGSVGCQHCQLATRPPSACQPAALPAAAAGGRSECCLEQHPGLLVLVLSCPPLDECLCQASCQLVASVGVCSCVMCSSIYIPTCSPTQRGWKHESTPVVHANCRHHGAAAAAAARRPAGVH